MATLVAPDSSSYDATLARDWAVQVNTGTLAAPVWEWINGITSFSGFPVTSTLQEAGDINSGVWGGQISTEKAWTSTLEILRKLDAAGDPDPGVEYLRARGVGVGKDGMAEIRAWRTDGLPDSYQGRGTVDFTTAAGDKTALAAATCTITGYGSLNSITKPSSVTVVKTFTLSGSPTSGTWSATVDTKVTNVMTSTVTRAQLESALEALSTVGEGNVKVTGTSLAAGYVATFNLAVTTVTAADTFDIGDVTVS